MILKPSTVSRSGDVTRLAAHLLRTDENEIAEVADVRGLGGRRGDLSKLLHSMHRTHAATRGQTGLFQVSINPDETKAHGMSPADWERALGAIEEEFSLGNQPRVLVLHHKKQRDGTTRPHIHAVYQVADVERGRQIDGLKWTRKRCIRLSRELEHELGHKQLPERAQKRGYDLPQHQQAKRNGHTVEERRQLVQEAWSRSDNAAGFRAALKEQGYDLAEGKRVLLVLPDGTHTALGRELDGVKAKEIKQRLAGHRLEPLEIVAERQKALGSTERARDTSAGRSVPEEPKQTHRRREAGREGMLDPTHPDAKAQERRTTAERGQLREQWTAYVQGQQGRPGGTMSYEQFVASRTGQELPQANQVQERPEATPGQLSGERPAASAREHTEEQFKETAADTQGKPATAKERAQAVAEAFAKARREKLQSQEQRMTERASQFQDNKQSAFRERFGVPKDRDDGLEHEI